MKPFIIALLLLTLTTFAWGGNEGNFEKGIMYNETQIKFDIPEKSDVDYEMYINNNNFYLSNCTDSKIIVKMTVDNKIILYCKDTKGKEVEIYLSELDRVLKFIEKTFTEQKERLSEK